MPDLIPTSPRHAAQMGEAGLVPCVPWRVQQAIDRQTARGLVAAAGTQADTFVAHTRPDGAALVARLGMQQVTELAADEIRYTTRTPTMAAAERYRAIADTYASLVTRELIKLGYDL